jgi:heterodisulfide reductase subunit A
VHLLERDDAPGGWAGRFACKATDRCLRCNVCRAQRIVKDAVALPDVTLHTNVTLAGLEESAGPDRFTAHLDNGQTLAADAVIMTTGFEPFDPAIDLAWQYGRLPNVLTGLDLETQHTAGRAPLTRPSDGQPPQSVAFIQCVGSRNNNPHRRPNQTNYCSAVCCAYALRFARLARHLANDTRLSVFNMDIQRFGCDFDRFLADCRQTIEFIKARPYRLTGEDNDTVRIVYEDQSNTRTTSRPFDLVVLSVGIQPGRDNRELSIRSGAGLDDCGFFRTLPGGLPGQTNRPGIYVAGTARGPMDLAAAIADGQATAATVLREMRQPAHA